MHPNLKDGIEEMAYTPVEIHPFPRFNVVSFKIQTKTKAVRTLVL